MIKQLKTVISNIEPENKNVIWVDTNDSNYPMKIYKSGWFTINQLNHLPDNIITSDNIQSYTSKINSRICNLPILPLTYGLINTSNGHLIKKDSGDIVSECVTTIPIEGMTVNIKLPEKWSVVFYYGTMSLYNNDNLSAAQSQESEILTNGDTFTFEKGYDTYRILFTSEDSISVEGVEEALKNGTAALTYENPYGTIIERNYDNEKLVKSIQLKNTTGTKMEYLPTFAHASDFHGDATGLKECLDYCDYLEISNLVITGDICANLTWDGWSYALEEFKKHKVIPIVCAGNHDFTNGYDTGHPDYYTEFSSKLSEMYNFVHDSNNPKSCYYYYDADDIKVRFIVLNQYETPSYGYSISEKQAKWFVETLKTVNEGYGIVVVMHQMEVPINKVDGSDMFFEDKMQYDDSALHDKLQTGNLLTKTIELYINQDQGSISVYDRPGTQLKKNYDLSVDFSYIDNENKPFICFCSAHTHRDRIGYNSQTTTTQLNMNISSSCACHTLLRDIPQDGGKGASRNVINICSIDKSTDTMNIVRIGANYNHNMEPRKQMSIKYKV